MITIPTSITKIKDLPSELQAKAIYNTFKQMKNSPTEDYSLKKLAKLSISEAFVWESSVEGHDFWAAIYYNKPCSVLKQTA